jgi:leader peptidase (prepilin peptidase) / N-methyltransferase
MCGTAQPVPHALRVSAATLPSMLAVQPWVAIAVALVVGLCVGSFLNVVVHRLPKMMDRAWRAQCAELRGEATPPEQPAKYNLAVPRSACPQCGHPIGALENIPVVSWLALRGACSACRKPISIRYPLVEALAGLLAAYAIWRFGVTWKAGAACVMLWMLLALTFIDFDTQLLPDNLTLPLVWAGLAVNLFGLFAPLADAVIGAIAGYLALWIVYWLFRLIRGKEGMGYGDFKLLAALGAWLGWQMLLPIILLAAFAGAVIGILMIALRGRDRNIPIPFGPYLAAAGWIALMWGDDLVTSYLHFAGVSSVR